MGYIVDLNRWYHFAFKG